MTKPTSTPASTARPPPPPSARSIYLSAVDAFKASVFSSSPTASPAPPPPPQPPRQQRQRPAVPTSKSTRKHTVSHKPAPPLRAPASHPAPARQSLSATVSDASSSDDDDNLGSGRLAKHQHTRPVAESDSDESWASSSDGEPTEQLPGSFWRPSDKSSSSEDECDTSASDSDSDSNDDDGTPQQTTRKPQRGHLNPTSFVSSSFTLPSDDALTSDAASHSHSDSMTDSSSATSPFVAQRAPSSPRRRRKAAGNLSIQTGTSVGDRRDQARLLLVSLLENFCMLYSPDENRLLFQILCEKLSAMGIITEADYNDHFSTVRGIYKRAFKELVFQALVATRAARDGQPRMRASGSLLLEYAEQPTNNGASAVNQVSSTEESSGAAASDSSNSSSCDSDDDGSPTREQVGSSSDDGINAKSRSSLTKRPVHASSSTSAQSDSMTVHPTRAAAAAAAAGLADLLDLHTTRYRTDFDEIRRLGRGGFGSVWHVRHRLDGREYAIKKVMLNNPKDFDRVLREVKVLARMDHPNIVRYHSAWLEHDEVSLTKPGGKGGAGAGADETFETDSLDLTTSSARLDDHSHASSSAGFTFARDSQAPSTNASDVETDGTDNDDDDDENYHDPNSTKARKTMRTAHVTASPTSPYRPLTLFIQMELCYSSLHDYLLHRNTLRHTEPAYLVAEANFLFSAMLVALEYIHERGTSHRDLTPRNLFLARKPGQYLRAAKARANANGTSKVQRGNSGTLVIDDEAALPLCEWLKVGSLDDISIKIGDFGLVTEHGRRADTSVFTTPTHSPSSVRAPWSTKVNGTSSTPSPEAGMGPRLLPEPAGCMSPSATSEDEQGAVTAGSGASSFVMPRPVLPPPTSKPPPVPRLPPGVAASVPPRGSSPRSPGQSAGASALATPPLAPSMASSSSGTPGVAAPGSSPIVPPMRLPPHLRRLPTHAPTLGIGTATYSAPEQIARSGSSKYRWHPITSDMFSLGVILLELLQPFSTGMERLITLERLRAPLGADRTLPPDFISQFPQYAAMVLWLTAEDPAHRPTPSELLGVFPPPVPDAIAAAGGGGSSRGSTRGSNRGIARTGRRGSNASIGSNGTTPTRGHPAAGLASESSEIARLRKIIDEQSAKMADKDRVIEDLRSKLEALHVRLGPPPTPPRAATPELRQAEAIEDWTCTTAVDIPPVPPLPPRSAFE